MPRALLLSLLVLVGHATAQATLTPRPFGDGSDGVFRPTADTTIDTDKQACLQFRSFDIPAAVTVTVKGTRPLYIKVLGAATIAGRLVSDGAGGAAGGNNLPGGAGGAGGAGGGRGGDGGCRPATPFAGAGGAGSGPAGGGGGQDSHTGGGGSYTDPVGGGGGGGNASAGAPGGPPNGPTKTPNVSGAGGSGGLGRGGSGGGGGGGDVDSTSNALANDGGAGGGGGGGWLTIAAPSMDLSGTISVNGGDGGTSTGNGGGGGGGAGGTIDLLCPNLVHTGALTAVGGALGPATQNGAGASPGGRGGDGVINVYGSIRNAGTATPTPIVQPRTLLVNPAGPLAVDIKTARATDNYMTGFGVTRSAVTTPWGVLCSMDSVFLLTLFADSMPPWFKDSNGIGSGTLMVGDPQLAGRPRAENVVLLQSVSFYSDGITGISNCLSVLIKL